ncbi:MAG: hypothetical protein ACTSSA_12545 [Candidatus Freyarchaeota archaeon]
MENPEYRRGWKFSLSWIKRKLEDRQRRKEAEKFLKQYFGRRPVLDRRGRVVRWEYDFPLSQWMKGKRPAVNEYQIRHVAGDNPLDIQNEMKRLRKLGVKVPEWISHD